MQVDFLSSGVSGHIVNSSSTSIHMNHAFAKYLQDEVLYKDGRIGTVLSERLLFIRVTLLRENKKAFA